MSHHELIVFDWDGTLMDSTHVIAASLRSACADVGVAVPSEADARYVIGLGVKSSSSELLVGNCDEFIFYEDLIRESKKTTALRGLPEKKAEAFAQLIEAIQALQRENKDTLWGSMVKQTMIRKNPAFNESYYGYSTFSKRTGPSRRGTVAKNAGAVMTCDAI